MRENRREASECETPGVVWMAALVFFLCAAPASNAGQIVFSSFLATEDGVPTHRLDLESFLQEVRALAFDPQEHVLYMIQKVQGVATASTLDMDTGVFTAPLSINIPETDDGVGLAFDTTRRALFLIAPHSICELDSNLEVRNCAATAPELFIGDSASLGYDPDRDAFWVLSNTFAPFISLVDHHGEVIDTIDTSGFLLEDEGMVSLDFDAEAGTLLVETRLFPSWSGQLLRVSRAGDLVERTNTPRRPDTDSGMAWIPTEPSSASHVLARGGFLRDDSLNGAAFYAPPPAFFVNGSSGGEQREVTAALGEPLTLFVDRPPAFNTSADPVGFLLYAWPGEASQANLSRFSFSPGPFLQEIGVPVFSLPFSSGNSAETVLVLNSTGLCSPGKGLFPASVAPTILEFSDGIAQPQVVTLQVLFVIRPTFVRLGNAIVLTIK